MHYVGRRAGEEAGKAAIVSNAGLGLLDHVSQGNREQQKVLASHAPWRFDSDHL